MCLNQCAQQQYTFERNWTHNWWQTETVDDANNAMKQEDGSIGAEQN